MIAKPQAKRIPPKLKAQILTEILPPEASIPVIAKKYDLSSSTLYNWRSNYNNKKAIKTINHSDNKKVSKNNNHNNCNFIELLPEESLLQKKDLDLTLDLDPSPHSKISSTPMANPNISKSLSEISLTFNHNISLSIKGNINSSSLIKILSALENDDSNDVNNNNNSNNNYCHHQDQSC